MTSREVELGELRRLLPRDGKAESSSKLGSALIEAALQAVAEDAHLDDSFDPEDAPERLGELLRERLSDYDEVFGVGGGWRRQGDRLEWRTAKATLTLDDQRPLQVTAVLRLSGPEGRWWSASACLHVTSLRSDTP